MKKKTMNTDSGNNRGDRTNESVRIVTTATTMYYH